MRANVAVDARASRLRVSRARVAAAATARLGRPASRPRASASTDAAVDDDARARDDDDARARSCADASSTSADARDGTREVGAASRRRVNLRARRGPSRRRRGRERGSVPVGVHAIARVSVRGRAAADGGDDGQGGVVHGGRDARRRFTLTIPGLKFFSLEVQPVVNVRVRCLGRMSEF